MKEMGRVGLYRNRNLGTKRYGCALAPLIVLVIIQNQGRVGRERNGRQRVISGPASSGHLAETDPNYTPPRRKPGTNERAIHPKSSSHRKFNGPIIEDFDHHTV